MHHNSDMNRKPNMNHKCAQVLTAMSGLAAGVNLPAGRVIIFV